MHNDIENAGFLRLWQIIGRPNGSPPIRGIFPVSASSWWAGVACGRYPAPIKIGPRTTAWRATDIANLIDDLNKQSLDEKGSAALARREPR